MERNRRSMLTAVLAAFFILLPFGHEAAAGSESVIPMGQSIGIQMDLTGVFVTNDVSVGDNVWLRAGDSVQKLDGKEIKALKDLETILPEVQKDQVRVIVSSGGEENALVADTNAFKRILPFLKDRTEGTGTLTYVDPQKGTYGALGHQIVDSSLKSPPSFKNGAIYLSEIEQIKKSLPGTPGYKISSIVKDEDYLGTIRSNGVYGIFGAWNSAYQKVLAEPLEIMQPAELTVGNAEIYTTVKGTEVESFQIEITKVEPEQFQFILTDTALLTKTGGILQGMSGSPVIQDGKFVGAVTHMFVDEPKKGAGLFLVTMRGGEK